MPLATNPSDDDVRDLLPAYGAGSLFPDEYTSVHAAVQRSPVLLAEAMELELVNGHLLELRARMDEQSCFVDA